MAAALEEEVVATVAEDTNLNAATAKKAAAFGKFAKRLREMPGNFCRGSVAAWVGAAGRRCRGKRSPPGTYKEAEPCVFSRSWPGHPAMLH
eukprot:9348916-Alexandrium_andersonii.AAC.1